MKVEVYILHQNELPPFLHNALKEAEHILYELGDALQQCSDYNHRKVLSAFQSERVAEHHFHGTTGYGLGDLGRDVLDKIMARVLGTQAALVRCQFVSGTHAIAAALYGVLRPGDHMLSVTGTPYDTLEEVIGIRGKGTGSLREFGISFSSIPLQNNGEFNYQDISGSIKENTRLIFVQRSCGYAWRKSININQIGELVKYIKKRFPNTIVFVDNCYGELVEDREPGDVGVDLMAGSLIKNLGGSIAPVGAYVAGRADLVEKAAARLTAPGIGKDVGATLNLLRLLFQGLYISPLTVAEAVKGAIFAAAFWQALGYEVNPQPRTPRTDLIQAIKLGSREKMIAFCQGLQSSSPINAYVLPEPSGMPGYDDEVIMAGGTFIQGSTSEFTADGPIREPYVVYQQGGISYAYIRLGNIAAAMKLFEKGLL